MRAAFSMTIDPDGAMHDWVDLPDGWSMIRIPTQEAIHALGIDGYQRVLIDVCERERPRVLVTHPPYDYLTVGVADRIRAAGTHVIAYAFDEPIFGAAYDDGARREIARIYDRYATTRDVRWATAPQPPLPVRATEHEVVLVGRAYPRRRALVQAIRAAGIEVVTRGDGWPEGFASRAAMLELYARAAIVLTTADWEEVEVPMAKHRLLDCAMLGAFQIAQAAPDLRAYFPEDEVPGYEDAVAAVAEIRRALANPPHRHAARARALREHTWSSRFGELVGPLQLKGDDAAAGEARSPLLDQLLLCLATRAEADGRIAAAAALFRECVERGAGGAAAAGGLGRCLRDCGDREEALHWLERALDDECPPTAAALEVTLPHRSVGTGLGRLCSFPPSAEPTALRIATLVELGRTAEAVGIVEQIASSTVARRVAAMLDVGDAAEHAELRRAFARRLGVAMG